MKQFLTAAAVVAIMLLYVCSLFHPLFIEDGPKAEPFAYEKADTSDKLPSEALRALTRVNEPPTSMGNSHSFSVEGPAGIRNIQVETSIPDLAAIDTVPGSALFYTRAGVITNEFVTTDNSSKYLPCTIGFKGFFSGQIGSWINGRNASGYLTVEEDSINWKWTWDLQGKAATSGIARRMHIGNTSVWQLSNANAGTVFIVEPFWLYGEGSTILSIPCEGYENIYVMCCGAKEPYPDWWMTVSSSRIDSGSIGLFIKNSAECASLTDPLFIYTD